MVFFQHMHVLSYEHQVIVYQHSAGVDNGNVKIAAPLEAFLMYSALDACLCPLLLAMKPLHSGQI